MEASIVDLRYKSKEILRALDRNEEVRLTYRGKLRGRIVPERATNGKAMSVSEHPFFGSEANGRPVDSVTDDLRKPRYE